jgi:hypothetical protein
VLVARSAAHHLIAVRELYVELQAAALAHVTLEAAGAGLLGGPAQQHQHSKQFPDVTCNQMSVIASAAIVQKLNSRFK